MPAEKPEIFSGFLRFSPFSSLFQNSNNSKNKKTPNANFDLLHGIGLVERCFRAVFREFFSPKTALFVIFKYKDKTQSDIDEILGFALQGTVAVPFLIFHCYIKKFIHLCTFSPKTPNEDRI